MDSQISIFDTENNGLNSEKDAYDILCSILRPTLENENMDTAQMRFRPGKEQTSEYSSIFVSSGLFMRLRFRGTKKYAAIPNTYFTSIKAEFDSETLSQLESASDFIRLPLSTPSDLMQYSEMIQKCFLKMLGSLTGQFDCCSRYEECSDLLRCVCPDKNLALGCRYKKNLRNGVVFYGKNAIN